MCQQKNFQDISKLQIHSSLSSTALCTAFCALSATNGRLCQSLVLQPSSQMDQKSQMWQSMIHAPSNNFHGSGVQSLKYCARSTAAIWSFRSPKRLEYSSGWISLPLFKSSNCLGVKANQRRIESIAVDVTGS